MNLVDTQDRSLKFAHNTRPESPCSGRLLKKASAKDTRDVNHILVPESSSKGEKHSQHAMVWKAELLHMEQSTVGNSCVPQI